MTPAGPPALAGARHSRRSFLKLAALAAAAWAPLPTTLPEQPRIASALPLAAPHRFLPDPEALLAGLPAADVLLVPAHIAASLIARGALQPLGGCAGRPHDPDGAFTRPYRYFAGALHGPQPAAWLPADWPAQAVWPADRRLVIGALLRRRGYSPNDAHPGHLAQVRADVLAWRPRLSADPLAEVRAGAARLAYGLAPLRADGAGLSLDARGALLSPQWAVLVEYDWAIPAGAPNPAAAHAFLAALGPAPRTPALSAALPLLPLAALPPAAHADYAEVWQPLTA